MRGRERKLWVERDGWMRREVARRNLVKRPLMERSQGGNKSKRSPNRIPVEKKGDWQTFFFTNFPEDLPIESLKSKLNEVGPVMDFFCPKKKDKRGNPFGFVRYPKFLDERSLLLDLNNIWFDSYKLRAYIPRYNRESQHSVKVDAKSFPASSGVCRPNVSFVNVVNAEEKEKRVAGNFIEPEVKFTSLESEWFWLKGYFSASLKKASLGQIM